MTTYVPTKRIRLKGKAMEALRRACFERDSYKCQHLVGSHSMFRYCCMKPVTWDSGHMAHIVNRSQGGPDTLDNVTTKCAWCHLVLEHMKGEK